MAVQMLKSHELLQNATDKYREVFNDEPNIAAIAPGRVNLIGEHLDYNDGFVLPMALPMVTVMVGKMNGIQSKADIVTYYEYDGSPDRIQIDLDNVIPGKPKWANYVKGVIKCSGLKVTGFNAVIMSNVPIGGGLSSSAAIEMATLTFLEIITGQPFDKLSEKALICQQAEHKFVGMPCGIMDQLISAAGKQDNVLLLDCRSLETFQIPFKSNDLAVLICNSNVRHELSNSEYPKRREECKRALELMNLNSYRDATLDHLQALMRDNVEEVLIKRARHVITEIKRTLEAAEALKAHNFQMMGKLMTESHKSLRDDFEVSCKEIDVLVDAANSCGGESVLGSRITGGGFGGCTVSLIRMNQIDVVIEVMKQEFWKVMPASCEAPTFYVCKPSDGARAVNL